MELDPILPPSIRRAYKAWRISQLRVANLLSQRSVTGELPVTVSVTSYGERLNIVGHAIESVAQGSVRPQRFILWIDNDDFNEEDYPMIKRQKRRGLEVIHTRDYGPFKKFYPFAFMTKGEEGPLITMDDDLIYPGQWLSRLYEAYLDYAGCFVGFRGHSIAVGQDGGLRPYAEWKPVPEGSSPSYRNFLTGGAGAVFSPAHLLSLADHGEQFLETCPKADDIWINVIANRIGHPGYVIPSNGLTCMSYPRSQRRGLYLSNLLEGGNDLQLAATLTSEDLSRLRL